MKILEAVNIYIHEIAVNQQLALTTIESYKNQLSKYTNYLKDLNIIEVNEINHNIIVDYVDELEGDLASSSISHAISVIRNFHQFIAFNYKDVNNPTIKIKIKKTSQSLPSLISNKDLDVIFDNFSEDFKDVYLNTIFEFLYSCGLRVSELCNLKVNDLSVDNKILKIKGKGSKERVVPISNLALKKLSDYLPHRSQYNKFKLEYLFINQLGNKLTRQYVWSNLKEKLLVNNITSDYSPHSFRHTYATHLLDGGADLRYVQELLGHSDIATTQIYVHLQDKRLKSDYDKYFLRGKK